MQFQQLNRSDPEKAWGIFGNSSGSTIPVDAAVALDLTTASMNGNNVLQPTTAGLGVVVGLADASIASGGFGLIQLYGYRASSVIFQTNSSYPAGARLVPVNAQNYLNTNSSSGDGLQGWFHLLASVASASASGTVSAAVHIRAM